MRLLDVLSNYRRGLVLRAMDDDIIAIVKAVKDTRKAGEITLKLKFNPSKAGDNEIEVKAEVTHKVPKPTIPAAIFYADDNGGLHRTDPAQIDAFEEEQGGATSLDRKRLEAMGDKLAAG